MKVQTTTDGSAWKTDPDELVMRLDIVWTSLNDRAIEERHAAARMIERLRRERDEARRAYCLEAGIWIGDEDECRRMSAEELARGKGWPWPIADPKASGTFDRGGDHAAERLRRGDVG